MTKTSKKKTLILPALISLLLSLSFLAAGSAAAQETVQFSELVIEIWPEYDRPEVLVIYRGSLSPEVSLPAEVTFEIPAEAGQPNAVAVRDANNQLTTVQFQRTVRGEVADVTFTTTSQDIQFEYYDPALDRSSESRSFTYRWPGNHLVSSAVIQVQEPRGAENLEITPPLGNSFPGSDGLTYYYDRFEPLGREPQEFTVNYQKAGSSLSFEQQQVQPSGPIEVQPSLAFEGRSALPWILGGIGLLLVVGAVLFYWWAGSGKELPAGLKSLFGSQAGIRSGGFCPNCGAARDPGDRFCRSCGRKLSG